MTGGAHREDKPALNDWDDLWDPEIERLIDSIPGIDPWCSSPVWAASANQAFSPASKPLLISEPGVGLALLCRYEEESDGDRDPLLLRSIAGLEPMWGFACPILTTDPEAFGPILADRLRREPDWDQIILPGFPSDLHYLRRLATCFHDAGFSVGAGLGITRQVADLGNGFDEYWERRRPRFRRNLRNARRRARSAAVQMDDASHEPDLLDRLQRIERRSWKGREDDGICSPAMAEFYRSMIDRLQPEGRIRATVAVRHGIDVGFILGGVRHSRYRGLQLSYAEEVFDLSLSHILQLHEIEDLCDRGFTSYDLGMDMEYKRRWADREDRSILLSITHAEASDRVHR